MSTTAPRVPEGRYGRSGRFGGDDARADRRLRAAAVVCGVLFAALVVWLGTSYLMRESRLHGEVTSFTVVSDTQVRAHVSVRKQEGVGGVCTIRSQSAEKETVGQADVAIPAKGTALEEDVVLRTVRRGTTAELLGCTPRP
ncbi:DUF4307 domain-containing protein [Streptacidiphilus sp. ASG 303]|uniref:DUF4307 domain-containing protein n=1 Tax=Streptacidiphilus sp. ASG 303 TaxID=2896847 RepID=UPI001E429925|nr:DUF4307 domain-containing protein [Streptacidiphilus sp. ASG 303]MCD0485764.1 DUF4307 domain-containing protein [Streptacidiphilus sp. ASG 303]